MKSGKFEVAFRLPALIQALLNLASQGSKRYMLS